ncbi:Hypothetical protein NocV09_01400420 [Nannochloropsis oceanica]
MAKTTTTTPRKLVELQYENLVANKDLSAEIEEAFGDYGLGILTVSGVPGLEEKRRALLPLAHRFASLPPALTKKYEHPQSFYSFGWSHGKETLQHGRPDWLKGSFYANPLHDNPSTDQDLIDRYPAFLHPNIWPSKDVPALESAFKDLGKLIVDVGAMVAKQCDVYVGSKCAGYANNGKVEKEGGKEGMGKLERVVRESRVCKGRLLHYFPYVAKEQEEEKGKEGKGTVCPKKEADEKDEEGGKKEMYFSTWCGWHNDHGSLTGLTSAMYLDVEGREVDVCSSTSSSASSNSEDDEEEEDDGGLYALSRGGEVVKILLLPHQLAFQIGETAQIHSGGLLRATPHAVKGSTTRTKKGLSRETFAVFMEPEMHEPMTMPEGRTVDDVCKKQGIMESDGGKECEGREGGRVGVSVPSLASRWDPSIDFAEFTSRTLKSYY